MINKIIRLKSIYMLFFFLLFAIVASAQERLLTLKQTNVTIQTALKEIEKQTSMSIVYNANDISVDKIVSVNVERNH